MLAIARDFSPPRPTHLPAMFRLKDDAVLRENRVVIRLGLPSALGLILLLAACAVGAPPRDGGWAASRGGYLGGAAGWGFARQPPANHPGN